MELDKGDRPHLFEPTDFNPDDIQGETHFQMDESICKGKIGYKDKKILHGNLHRYGKYMLFNSLDVDDSFNYRFSFWHWFKHRSAAALTRYTNYRVFVHNLMLEYDFIACIGMKW